MVLGLIFNLLLLFASSTAFTAEPQLSNIQQLTSPTLGFKRAGEAYFSPDGQSILFQAVPLEEDDYQIYAMDLTSHKIQQISQNSGACTCSFFRPDGKKIIFAASPFKTQKSAPGRYTWDLTPFMNIYESNPDGSDPIALTEGSAYHAECAYAPDGGSIVYASNEDGHMNLYAMKSDGSDKRQITHSKGIYNGGPFFSPDGKKIVFRADLHVPHHLQVCIIDSDGSNFQQLTNNEAINWAPFWHPSGKKIAYTTSILGHGNYQIFLHDLESGSERQLTETSGFNGLPVFNHDGTKLMWTSKRSADSSSQIFIADFEDL